MPTSVRVSSVTSESVTVAWDEQPGASKYEVLAVNKLNPLLNSTKFTRGKEPFTITGLPPATVFEIYVKAIFETGRSAFSPVIEQVTGRCRAVLGVCRTF